MNYYEKSKEARRKVLDMIYAAQSSHIASNFSCIDFLTVLYDKADLSKDEIIISKGWIAASVYYFLSEKGIVPKDALESYCKDGSPYIGLIEPSVPGVKCAGGSMGYGLPFGVGFALAKKIKKEEGLVYVVMSDGEQPIGTTWESAALAAHHELDNLVVFVDVNKLQAMGYTKDILDMEIPRDGRYQPSGLVQKWKAFGWRVYTADGHNHDTIASILEHGPKDWKEKDNVRYQNRRVPTVIICDTIKGKGVSFMENKLEWHYKNILPEQYEAALKELV